MDGMKEAADAINAERLTRKNFLTALGNVLEEQHRVMAHDHRYQETPLARIAKDTLEDFTAWKKASAVLS